MCDNHGLSNELEDGNAYDRDESGDESRSSSPVPTSATSGMGHARPESPGPALDLDRQMSANEI